MSKLYGIYCPECGRMQGKSAEGTDSLVSCTKCGAKLNYKVNDHTVYVKVIVPSRKSKSVSA